MEEDILGIIERNPPFFINNRVTGTCAKEIAFHMTEFIEWLVEDSHECGFEKETFDLKPVWYRIDEDKDYSLEEMYQYWGKNIHKTK